MRAAVEAGEWRDGRVTAGVQSALAKHNLQLANDGEAARDAGEIVLARAWPPMPCSSRRRCRGGSSRPCSTATTPATGHRFGEHVDNALRPLPGGGRIRTDVSATLFLSDPADYDGGELVIEDSYGAHSVKLAAGDMILYPVTSLHRVEPVTRGTRLASFFWIESMVREDSQRTLLLDMDAAVRTLAGEVGDDHPAVVR